MTDKNYVPDSAAQPDTTASASGCRMTGGICACRSGGSFGGCAKERADCCTNEPSRASLAPVSALTPTEDTIKPVMTVTNTESTVYGCDWDGVAPGTYYVYAAPVSAQQGAAEQQAASVEQQANVPMPFAAPAGKLNSDERVEAIGEVAELYGRLLAHKQRVHAEKGRDRGTEYYIADGIRWAIGELDRRGSAKGGDTSNNEISDLATKAPAPQQSEPSDSCAICSGINGFHDERCGAAKAPAAQAVDAWTAPHDHPPLVEIAVRLAKQNREWSGKQIEEAARTEYAAVLAASPATAPEAMTSEQQPATQQDEVNEIPLSDMHGARLVKDDDGHWALMRDEALMRYLDRFERGFVDSAIIAAMSAKHEGAK